MEITEIGQIVTYFSKIKMISTEIGNKEILSHCNFMSEINSEIHVSPK